MSNRILWASPVPRVHTELTLQDGGTSDVAGPTRAIQQTDRIPLLFAYDDHAELVVGYQETSRDIELLVLDPET